MSARVQILTRESVECLRLIKLRKDDLLIERLEEYHGRKIKVGSMVCQIPSEYVQFENQSAGKRDSEARVAKVRKARSEVDSQMGRMTNSK